LGVGAATSRRGSNWPCSGPPTDCRGWWPIQSSRHRGHTAWAFFESASDGLDALAFVGHAVTITEGGIGSVGLRFIDKAIVRLGFTAPPQETLSFDTLSANARVVFIASCQIGEEFRRLWEYRNQPGRALVYPVLLPPASENEPVWLPAGTISGTARSVHRELA
jgi:hypothetical protein